MTVMVAEAGRPEAREVDRAAGFCVEFVRDWEQARARFGDVRALTPFQDRRFFEEVKHPVIGNSRYSTLPIRFEHRPERWHTRHAPLLGEHNRELLLQLGLTGEDIDALEAEGVIGESLVSGA